MQNITKDTVLFTYGVNGEHSQTVETFLKMLNDEELENIRKIAETLEDKEEKISQELLEIANTFETLIEKLLEKLGGGSND